MVKIILKIKYSSSFSILYVMLSYAVMAGTLMPERATKRERATEGKRQEWEMRVRKIRKRGVREMKQWYTRTKLKEMLQCGIESTQQTLLYRVLSIF